MRYFPTPTFHAFLPFSQHRTRKVSLRVVLVLALFVHEFQVATFPTLCPLALARKLQWLLTQPRANAPFSSSTLAKRILALVAILA